MLLHSPDAKLNQTWNQLSQLYDLYGNIRHIGVSNYQQIHLKQLEDAPIKPYANQIEITPFLTRQKLRQYCKNQDIQIIAHSSLTKGRQLNITSATILLKWALQKNLKIIPRSANQKHIFDNFNLGSELLSEQIMKHLDELDCGFATHPQHI
jgi:diketogulonate reductase-like aldo/keto reductase